MYVHVLIDGVLTSFTSSSSYWFPEQTITLSVFGVSGSGVKIVKVIANNGISDYGIGVIPTLDFTATGAAKIGGIAAE